METSVQNNCSSVLGYKLKNKARVYRREPKQIKGCLTIHSYKQYQELKKGIDQGANTSFIDFNEDVESEAVKPAVSINVNMDVNIEYFHENQDI